MSILYRMAGQVRKPKVIVFDLDYTLWPFWVDTHVDPPFRKQKDGKVYDSRGAIVSHYPDSPDVLKTLASEGYKLAVASRTSATDEANSLLKLFHWDRYFKQKEIYPGSKVTHLKRIKDSAGVEYKDIVFFDDEHRNIVDTTELGVHAVLVKDGVCWSAVRDALAKYSNH